MTMSFTDRYGMTLSTQSASAAACWQEGLDRLLSQNAGPDMQFAKALEHDPEFAMAHTGLAFWYMQRARPEEARASIHRAFALAQTSSRRERQQMEAVRLWIQGQGRDALARLTTHLAEFPRDALLLRLAHLLYNRGCSSVGVANFPPAYLHLLQGCAPHCMEDWAFLAEYAFAHHETGALPAAMDYARRSLTLNPRNAVATHSVAHVYLEQGDAVTGADFLGTWIQGFDCPAASYVHLSWHQALFELALGRYQAALERYERDIRPSIAAGSMATLADGASFLWRLQLYGGDGPPPFPGSPQWPDHWQEVLALATPTAARPGLAFQVAHAAMALAAAEDRDGTMTLLEHLQDTAVQGDLFVRDCLLPLVRGIVAFAQHDYAQAIRLLEPVCPQLVRIGGSHAQREVFEETLLEAYLRAEQFPQAEAMLRERLKRRVSVRDTYWLGRAQAGQGQAAQAKASFDAALQGWQEGDWSAPERLTLNRFAAAIA